MKEFRMKAIWYLELTQPKGGFQRHLVPDAGLSDSILASENSRVINLT